MNIHYQYAMLDGYNYANSRPQPNAPESQQAVRPTPSTRPQSTRPQSQQAYRPMPVTSTPSLYDQQAASTTGASDTTATGSGDTTVQQPDRTTINIFNPSGQTSTTSLSDEVTVDGGTGESSSTASQGGASGGIFGGGKDGKEKMNNPKNLAKRKKTYLPLLFIVAGISIFIFKPFK